MTNETLTEIKKSESSEVVPNEPAVFSDQVPSVSESAPSEPPVSPEDVVKLKVLLDAGHDLVISNLAVKQTKGQHVAASLDWILEHTNEDSDFSSSDSYSEDEDADESEENTEKKGNSSQLSEMEKYMTSLVQVIKRRPHKMVFVVNMALAMGKGKLAAQVGHATLGCYRRATESEQGSVSLKAWTYYGEKKIVVKAKDDDELRAIQEEAQQKGLHTCLVRDAGHTQIAPGSQTVLAVFGPEDAVNDVTGKQKLL